MCSVQNPSLQFLAENSLAERRKGKQQNLMWCLETCNAFNC